MLPTAPATTVRVKEARRKGWGIVSTLGLPEVSATWPISTGTSRNADRSTTTFPFWQRKRRQRGTHGISWDMGHLPDGTWDRRGPGQQAGPTWTRPAPLGEGGNPWPLRLMAFQRDPIPGRGERAFDA